MEVKTSVDYREFIVSNRIKINHYLNIILWFFTVTGPAIALGVKSGAFPDITYFTCFSISAVVVVLSGVHLLLLKQYPDRKFTSYFALTSLDVLLVYMVYGHVSIYLTWFLVPLLSILFCDKAIYRYALILNYILMLAATWFSAPFRFAEEGMFENPTAWFFNVTGGFTIETVIMAISGYIIVRLAQTYYQELFRQNALIREKEENEQEKLNILDSMAEIYDNVNLISFIENTEMSLRNTERTKHGIDMSSQTHTLMNQRIKNQVMPDQLNAFLTFTNITTVRDRLENRKIISSDFIDVVTGWFRAQYITVKTGSDGKPDIVIYTTRNVDEEKRREEHLIRLSMTDEMTRLYNRRCYDEDLAEYRSKPLDDDFVLFSVDVNGLKTVNDTKGHSAGDELIKGAADCLALSIRHGGRVYRTGGDEFMAVAHTNEPEAIRKEIRKKAAEWHGMYTDEITMSVGYAAFRDYPDAALDELERIADADMYSEKEKHYREKGIDRRRS